MLPFWIPAFRKPIRISKGESYLMTTNGLQAGRSVTKIFVVTERMLLELSEQ